MGKEKLLDLARENLLATTADHVFQAAGDADVTVFVHGREITAVQPARLVDHLPRAFGIVVVAAHHLVAAITEFAGLAARQDAPGRGVDDLLFLVRHDLADAAHAQLQRIIHLGHVADGRSLGHAAGDGDLCHMHLLHYALHYLDRTRRTGHDPGAERRQIEIAELRMIQFRNKHRGHAVQRGAALTRDGLQRLEWRKMRGGQDHRRAVSHASEIREHHPETMIKRHRDAEPVAVRETHSIADPESIVEDVVMREHRTLGKARRARGVLDVNDVIELEGGRPFRQGGRCDGIGFAQKVLPFDEPRFPESAK